MIVLLLSYDELNVLHNATECEFFKCGVDEGEVHNVALDAVQKDAEGRYVYGVDRFAEHYPDIDISGYARGEYVPQEVE